VNLPSWRPAATSTQTSSRRRRRTWPREAVRRHLGMSLLFATLANPDECLHAADVPRVTRNSSRDRERPIGLHSTRMSRRRIRAPADVRTVSAVSRTREESSPSSRTTARSYANAVRLSLARRTRVERVESKIRLSLGRGASELEAELARRGRQDSSSLPTAVDPSSVSAAASFSTKSTGFARLRAFWHS